MYLALTLAILRHETTRKYTLRHVLYPLLFLYQGALSAFCLATADWDAMFLSSSEGNGKPGLGSWNEERTDSSLYPVRGAAVTGVHNCIVRAHSALTLSVLLGMRLG